MIILNQSFGNSYSQQIVINLGGGDNKVKVEVGNEVVFDDVATHIVDEDNLLTFKDVNGEQHQFMKYSTYSVI